MIYMSSNKFLLRTVPQIFGVVYRYYIFFISERSVKYALLKFDSGWSKDTWRQRSRLLPLKRSIMWASPLPLNVFLSPNLGSRGGGVPQCAPTKRLL